MKLCFRTFFSNWEPMLFMGNRWNVAWSLKMTASAVFRTIFICTLLKTVRSWPWYILENFFLLIFTKKKYSLCVPLQEIVLLVILSYKKKLSTKFSCLNCTRKKFGMWNGRRHILTEVQIPVLPFVYTYEKTFQSYWLNSNPSHIRYTL